MKVIVDELPKSCGECFCNVDATWCALSDGEMGDICEECDNKTRHKKCPLQSLAEHDKQVRKEVCDEIRKWCDKNFNWVGDGTGHDGQDYSEMIGSNNTINKLREFLDQIQGDVNKTE